jgi:hypothetical protein
MLIHDDGHLRAIAAHDGQHLVEEHRAGHIGQRAGILGGHGFTRFDVPQHLLDMQASDDGIQAVAIHRVSGVRMMPYQRLQLRRRRTNGDAGEHHARNHDLPGRPIAELEQFAEDRAGLTPEQSALLTLFDYVLELLGRVIPLGGHRLSLDAHQPQ